MTTKTLNRSFAGGEISPQLFSRIDLDKFQTGLALCLNCETLPQGPVQNRAGYQWVLEAKDSTKAVVLIPFSFSTQQTFALEFGHQYVRFHTLGGTLLEGSLIITNITNSANPVFTTSVPHGYATGQTNQLGNITSMPALNGRWVKISSTPAPNQFTLTDLAGNPISTAAMPAFFGSGSVARVYEIATPYDAAQLRLIKYVQSADVLTLVSPYYPPQELRRLGATNWTMSGIQFTSALAAPQTNANSPNNVLHTYRVVALAPTNGGFSIPSAAVSATNDFTIPGHFNRVSWSSVPGGVAYYIFKLIGGNWLFIGSAATGTFFDDDITRGSDPTVNYAGTSPAPTAAATAVVPATTGVSVVPTGAGAIPYTYVVTSINTGETEESLASGAVTANNDLSVASSFNTVKWPAVPGVSLYNVYRSLNGIFGFVGRADIGCSFVDNNILPNTGLTPPLQIDPFQGDGNYPRAVTYHQQRRVFAGSINNPQTMWTTRSGTERNLGYSVPSRDDDGITVRVVSREANTIRHMVPMNDLILLTSGGEWKCASGDGSGVITPSNTSLQPQGYTGSSEVQAATTDRTILFAQDRGGAIRELQFAWEQQGYQTSNASILAPHLFDYHLVVQLAFSRSPLPSLWSVRNDGRLLGMTYVPEHEIKAWHQHVTDGAFESICSVAEGDEDVLYAVVLRVINGRTVRYIERKHTRRFDTPADQFFVDSGATYDGPETDTIGGLYHLEGKTVAILADGGVSPPQVVVNGSIALDAPASKVQVGLPYVAQIKTLPISVQTQAFGQGMRKNVNKVFLRVLASNGFEAGPTFDKLRQYPTRFSEPYGSPPDLVSDEVPLTLSPRWAEDGAVCIQQAEPLSLMLLGMAIEVATGN
ncbi:hypothetical protein [Variovorax sp. GT1P44]|uniref:hypothetical protein n=1 Tax=Variovorax sp. GT1P44 TaxID=3443742 RepID=UPI003F47FB0C